MHGFKILYILILYFGISTGFSSNPLEADEMNQDRVPQVEAFLNHRNPVNSVDLEEVNLESQIPPDELQLHEKRQKRQYYGGGYGRPGGFGGNPYRRPYRYPYGNRPYAGYGHRPYGYGYYGR